jgi:hypothetical protein
MNHTPGPLQWDHQGVPMCGACLQHWFTTRPRRVDPTNYLNAYHHQHQQTGH